MDKGYFAQKPVNQADIWQDAGLLRAVGFMPYFRHVRQKVGDNSS
jgi:hypothetical protein